MIRFRFLTLIFTIFFQCNIFNSRDTVGKDNLIHLVLNSTGFATEFCIYKIEKVNDSCNLQTLKSYPKCMEYFPENGNAPTIDSKLTLDQIYKGLADLEISRPWLKQKISNVGFIASGSFNSAKEAKQVTKDVEQYFKSEQINVNSKVLSSEEEVKFILAALQSNNSETSKNEMAVLQIGPDTVDLAFSGNSKNSKPMTSKIGINALLEEISNIKPGINSCRQPISSFFKSEASSFDKCKAFILENLNKSKRLAPFAKIQLDSNFDVYTTGSSWQHYYLDKSEVTLEELNKTGNEFCSLTIDQILKKGIKKKYAYNLCYSLAYKAVLIESLNINKLQILKKDIYLKNFAVSPNLFPGICK